MKKNRNKKIKLENQSREFPGYRKQEQRKGRKLTKKYY